MLAQLYQRGVTGDIVEIAHQLSQWGRAPRGLWVKTCAAPGDAANVCGRSGWIVLRVARSVADSRVVVIVSCTTHRFRRSSVRSQPIFAEQTAVLLSRSAVRLRVRRTNVPALVRSGPTPHPLASSYLVSGNCASAVKHGQDRNPRGRRPVWRACGGVRRPGA